VAETETGHEQGEFLRATSRQVSWQKLEREAKRFAARGWACLQEKEANDPKEVPLDWHIQRLCRRYVNGTPWKRASLRAKVSPHLCSALQHFAWRMAVRALRTKSEEAVKLGLAAISIEDARLDTRETIGWLALLYHAAVRIQCDVDRCFQHTASISSGQTRHLIRSFLLANPEPPDILKYGFAEETSEGGATLVWKSRHS
jgi:hypothetical protein